MSGRVLVYLRVSKERGQSVRMQFQRVRDFCASRDWRIVRVYREHRSAAKARPVLRRLMADAAMRRGDAVVVWAIDRFARSVIELRSNVARLAERGVVFVSMMEPAIDTSTAAGTLVLTLMGAMAEFERARISERTRESCASRRRRGLQLGRPSLGAQVDLVHVRERMAAGHSIVSVAAATYVVPRKGGAPRPISERTLRRLLRSA